jgi:Tol biopolymer transport system component
MSDRTRRRVRLGGAAALAALVVPVVALAGIDGPTELISIGPGGQNPVTERGVPAVSADGRYVAFHTAGRDIDAADTNPFDDVFVYDRQTDSFDRVSKSVGGGDGDNASTSGRNAVSADGDVVAFSSKATNLVPSDNNLRQDVFVRDRSAATTELISRNAAGLDANGSASEATISADGTKVAFLSDAPDVFVGDMNGTGDVFVHDLSSNSTELVSANTLGLPANGVSSTPIISADGTRVAFGSAASDIVSGDSNNRLDVFVRDLASDQTERVNLTNSGGQANGDTIEPFLSADGRYVGFSTRANNLGGLKFSGATDHELYLRDTVADRTERLSFTKAGYESTNGTNRLGSIAPDGRLVAFASNSTSYAAGDSNTDVFVLDRATDQITILSRSASGAPSNGSSSSPVVSSGGVAFRSLATNLSVPGGAFNSQVFFRPFSADSVAADIDGDGLANLDDVCPTESDSDQTDTDGEGHGDACDLDDDADVLLDTVEPAQSSDPKQFDTDGDGLNDNGDDYPADSTKQLGTAHQTINVGRLDSADGDALAKFFFNTSGKFDTRTTGKLLPNTTYTVTVYRRHPLIRRQLVCTARTDAAGIYSCSKSAIGLNYFTHMELSRGSTVVVAVECAEQPNAIGERRCDVP